MSLFSLVNRYMNWRQQYCETTNISDLLTYICWVKMIKVSQVIWIFVRTLLHEKIIDKSERYESVGKVRNCLILMKKIATTLKYFQNIPLWKFVKSKKNSKVWLYGAQTKLSDMMFCQKKICTKHRESDYSLIVNVMFTEYHNHSLVSPHWIRNSMRKYLFIYMY